MPTPQTLYSGPSQAGLTAEIGYPSPAQADRRGNSSGHVKWCPAHMLMMQSAEKASCHTVIIWYLKIGAVIINSTTILFNM